MQRAQRDVAPETARLQKLTSYAEASEPEMRGKASNILTNAEFTLDNFERVFSGDEFLQVLWVTVFYTLFGTLGAFGLASSNTSWSDSSGAAIAAPGALCAAFARAGASLVIRRISAAPAARLAFMPR